MFKMSYDLTKELIRNAYPDSRIYGEKIPGRTRNYEVFIKKGNDYYNIWAKRISKKT